MKNHRSIYPADDMTICVSCGVPSRVGAKFCPRCGMPLLSSQDRFSSTSQRALRNYHPPKEIVKFDLIEAIVFPFYEKRWLAKLVLLPFLAIVPVFSNILFRGWQLNITRRIGRRKRQWLPYWDDVGMFFADGVVLWIIKGLYWLPLVLVTAIFRLRYLEATLTILGWIYNTIILKNSSTSFSELLMQMGFALATTFVLPVFYIVVTYPMYQVAVIRYAITGRISSFFQVFANLKLFVKHFSTMLALFFYDFIIRAILTFVGGVFAATFIGLILVPTILGPVSEWAIGYLLGTAAARLHRTILLEERYKYTGRPALGSAH